MVNNLSQYNSRYVMAISFVSALGGYLFGFDFAVISGALPFLKQSFGLTPVWEGFVTGSLALGCIIGCLMAGSIAEKYGRRPGLMLAAIIFAGSALAIAFDGRYWSWNGFTIESIVYSRNFSHGCSWKKCCH